MSITAPIERQSEPSRTSTATARSAGRVHVQPRRVLRLRRVADRQARHVRRRVPQGPPARRRVAVLLRHRQLRRRRRHRQPLRHGRPVRRPLQRRLPQGRARPPWRTSTRRSSRRRSRQMLDDWTNEGFDPFAAPDRDRLRLRRQARREPGGDHPPSRHRRAHGRRARATSGLRTDDNGHPVNRHFADVAQDEPEMHPEPGFEDEVHSFNLFAYLSRSQVTWNPSVVSVCGDSLYCPTTEEYILPIIHGNDRVEWFIQLSDEIDLGGRGPRHGAAARQGDDAGRRRRGDAGRHPPPGLRPEARDAAGLGERRSGAAGAHLERPAAVGAGRVLGRRAHAA